MSGKGRTKQAVQDEAVELLQAMLQQEPLG